jgi:hypothetical protein
MLTITASGRSGRGFGPRQRAPRLAAKRSVGGDGIEGLVHANPGPASGMRARGGSRHPKSNP